MKQKHSNPNPAPAEVQPVAMVPEPAAPATLADAIGEPEAEGFAPVAGRPLAGKVAAGGSRERTLQAFALRTGTVAAQSRRQLCRLLGRLLAEAGLSVPERLALAAQVIPPAVGSVDRRPVAAQFTDRLMTGRIGFVAPATREQVAAAGRALFVAARGMSANGPAAERPRWQAIAGSIAALPLADRPAIGVETPEPEG